MDGMKIESKFMCGLVSKAISAVLRKKLGYRIDIKLTSLTVDIVDGQTKMHIETDAEMSKEELLKIVKEVGLD